MDPLADMHAAAAEQRQVLARAQARRLGVANSTFSDHAKRLGWQQQHRGVWLLPDRSGNQGRATVAAACAVGEPLLVTGATALWLQEILPRAPAQVELLLPADRHVTRPSGACLHRTRLFDTVRAEQRDGLRLTNPARALADYAAHAGRNALIFAAADACRLRRCTLAQVRAELEARGRFPGRARLRQAVEALEAELTHSRYERLGRRLLRDAGVRVHPRPFPVEHRDRIVAEIDLAVVELRYGAEIDGPPHLRSEVAARDRARDRLLGSLGWTIDRFLWFDLEERPQAFVTEVKRRIAQLRR